VGGILLLSVAQGGAGAHLEDVERVVGPLEIGAQRFTVVLHKKRASRNADPDFGETLARLEIKNEAGAVQYQKTFPYEAVGNGFTETLDATVQVLQGKRGSGILITYGTLPSTPLGGKSWQVFGPFSGPPSAPLNRRIVPFSKPISTEGQLISGKPGESIVQTSQEPKLQGDVLHFRVWTGNFFVIIPLRILWFRNEIGPAWRCSKLTPKGPRPVCQYQIEAQRTPSGGDMTFVRLHVEAEEGMGIPAHVVVRQDSKVEFLEAEVELRWQEDTDGIGMGIGDDPWLKVRVDGKEGWIHTQEDFVAVGLPLAG
jgi:hypothetical protein